MKHFFHAAAAVLAFCAAGSAQQQTPQMFVTRTLSTDTVFYEGAPTGTRTTVTLRAYGSGDSLTIGFPIDVVFVPDNSGSMGARVAGDRNWVNPSRIQGVYNAEVNFIDSFINVNDRVAQVRFGGLVETSFVFTNNFTWAKAKIDTTVDGSGNGTAVFTGILMGIKYAIANRRAGVVPVVIALTDGEDNASGSYGSYYQAGAPNLGNSIQAASDSVVRLLDSIRLALGPNAIKVFTINLGTTSQQTQLQQIAAAGNGSWAYSATGTNLNSVFQGIGQSISDVAAVRVAPGEPMIVDVLGPGIHYVVGTYAVTTGANYLVPGFSTDVVNGLTRLKFTLDTVRLGKVMEVRYDITAALSVPSLTPTLMRTNNSSGDDAGNYSLVNYINAEGDTTIKSVPKNFVWVKSGVGGLFLSTSATSVVQPWAATGTIALQPTISNPDTFPNTILYALVQLLATGTSTVGQQSSAWYFTPLAGWAGPTFSGGSAAYNAVSLSVPYTATMGNDTLRIQATFQGVQYSDRLIFSAFTTEQLARIGIDNDTAQLPLTLDSLVITGNYGQLAGLTRLLFARGVTNLGNPQSINATWSVSGFTVFDFSGIAGTGTTKNLVDLTPPANANTPLNDAGIIRVDYQGFTGQMQVIIRDTTDYDTVEAVVLLKDSLYRATSDKNSLYDLYVQQSVYSAYAGDTVRFSALTFDVNLGGVEKFLGAGGFLPWSTQRVQWFLNGSPLTGDSTVSFTKTVAGSQDQLVAVWGTIRDTVLINWGFGRRRILHIESAPGVYGTANPAPADSFTFGQATLSITAYAVIRDEFGYCVSVEPLELWRLEPPATAAQYLSTPRLDSLASALLMTKIQTPPSEERFRLIAKLSSQVIEGVSVPETEDTALVIMVNYSFIGVRIVADSSNRYQSVFYTGIWKTGNYGNPNVSYTRNYPIFGDTVKVVALDDTVVFGAQLQRSSDSAWSASSAVSWSLSDFSWLDQQLFPTSNRVTLAPVRRGGVVRLVASYNTGSGTVYDTIFILVEAPRLNAFLVTPPPLPVTAGVTVPLSIKAVDVAGNPVTDPTRVPTRVCYTVVGTMVITVNGSTDTVTDGTFCVDTPFVNGELITQLMSFVADTHKVTVTVTHPGGVFTYDLVVPVVPGPPASVVIVRKGSQTAVLTDTLSSFGTLLTVKEYTALVYDAYGNLITDPAVLSRLTWSMSGALPANRLSAFSSNASYNASGLSSGGLGTLTVTYNVGSITVTDNALLFVMPLVGVSFISTHEWLVDTSALGLTEARRVLQEVGGVNPAGLSPLDVLRALRNIGFQPIRDGYLDYLNIQLSDSLPLLDAYVTWVSFDTLVPGKDTVAVSWAPGKLSPLDGSGRRYRLWLKPNSVTAGALLETGFLPMVTFDNAAIRKASLSNPPRLLGTGDSLYTTHPSLVRDSAAPVVHRFLLKNNACNESNPLNKLRIAFSEPVKSAVAARPLASTNTAFVLINGSSLDSAFMTRDLIGVQRTADVVEEGLAWDFDETSDWMMVLEGTVQYAANGSYLPNTSRIRLALDLTQTPVIDVAGNVGSFGANREAVLENQGASSGVCQISGNTVANRYDAMEFHWSPLEGGQPGEMVPDFPYFGFTVDLSLVDHSEQNVEVARCTGPGQNFVVLDYDTGMVFVMSDVTIFDLFGNLVSTPVSNTSLHNGYTIEDVREHLGIRLLGVCGETPESLLVKYIRTPAQYPSDPDTLRPRYPFTFTVDYNFMVTNCGPGSGDAMCVPSWNALNAKGRLVAPGGYIAVQRIVTPGRVEEIVRKVIITSKERRR